MPGPPSPPCGLNPGPHPGENGRGPFSPGFNIPESPEHYLCKDTLYEGVPSRHGYIRWLNPVLFLLENKQNVDPNTRFIGIIHVVVGVTLAAILDINGLVCAGDTGGPVLVKTPRYSRRSEIGPL